MHGFQLVDAVLLPMLVIAGIAFGFYLPNRLFGRLGFAHGVAVGSPLALLFSVMGAYLLASWGEQLIGGKWGVPIGAILGSLTIAIAMNSLAGLAGRLVYLLLKR